MGSLQKAGVLLSWVLLGEAVAWAVGWGVGATRAWGNGNVWKRNDHLYILRKIFVPCGGRELGAWLGGCDRADWQSRWHQKDTYLEVKSRALAGGTNR